MTRTSSVRTGTSYNVWRVAGWATIAILIALPAVAMRFTDEVDWGVEDFAFAIVMLGGTGLAFKAAVRASRSRFYRAGVAVALGAGLSMLWANAAVGIVGDEQNDVNMWFDAVPAVALTGAIVARFRASGMAIAMGIAATAQIVVGIVVQLSGHLTWIFTLAWASGWIMSARLFRQAEADR